ncbi:MAG: alpha/beta fold hydrolase [Alphaproteobacteria bacterium]
MKFLLPSPRKSFDVSLRDGAVIRIRQHGNPRGPRIALCHGNGLASDAYYPFWRLLEADYELIVFDVRNHGRNPQHGAQGHCWANFASDQVEIHAGIAGELGARPTIAAFHSLSAIAGLRLAVDGELPWTALLLFDPPICPPEGHALHRAHFDDMAMMTRRSERRPERYRSTGMFEFQLRAGRGFQRWVEGAHRLVAETTLRRDEAAGDWTLACPRALEAKVFRTNMDAGIWPRIGNIEAPIRLVGADPGLEGATQPASNCRALAREFGLAYDCIEGTTHFLQIEQPETCARIVKAFVAEHAMAV